MYWSNTTKSKCLATISVAQAKAIGVYNRRSPSSQSKEITTSPSRQIHGPIGPVNIFLSSSHIRWLPYLETHRTQIIALADRHRLPGSILAAYSSPAVG